MLINKNIRYSSLRFRQPTDRRNRCRNRDRFFPTLHLRWSTNFNWTSSRDFYGRERPSGTESHGFLMPTIENERPRRPIWRNCRVDEEGWGVEASNRSKTCNPELGTDVWRLFSARGIVLTLGSLCRGYWHRGRWTGCVTVGLELQGSVWTNGILSRILDEFFTRSR